MATKVLPSPVRISATLPSCKTTPPMSCTSKCRIPIARTPPSRTTAKASGSSASNDSPCWKRSLNSWVFARSASSSRPLRLSSRALIFLTVFLIRRSTLSLREPNIIFSGLAMVFPNRVLRSIVWTAETADEHHQQADITLVRRSTEVACRVDRSAIFMHLEVHMGAR